MVVQVEEVRAHLLIQGNNIYADTSTTATVGNEFEAYVRHGVQTKLALDTFRVATDYSVAISRGRTTYWFITVNHHKTAVALIKPGTIVWYRKTAEVEEAIWAILNSVGMSPLDFEEAEPSEEYRNGF